MTTHLLIFPRDIYVSYNEIIHIKGDKNEELRRENEELRCQTQNCICGDWYSSNLLVPEPPCAQGSQQLPQGPRPI